LHAAILRPKGLASGAKTPVILSMGPYFNHSGQVGAAGPVEDTSYDPVGPAGPSDRFRDFIQGAKLMERGYTYEHAWLGPWEHVRGNERDSSGEKTLDRWSADWKVPAGHRIAVRVTDANEDWWIHTPLFDTVKVVGGSVTLPFPGTQLEDYLSETITGPPERMRDSVSSSFNLPPAQQPQGG
jgi:hypothetical protein